MNKKGFTLLELLAVIIILAIIALVTTPTILNVINNARRDAAKDKAWGIMKAVEFAYTQEQSSTGETVALPIEVGFAKGSKPTVVESGAEIKFSGDKPVEGKVIMHKNGKLSCCNLKFGDYYCTTKDGIEMNCDTAANGGKVTESTGCAGKDTEI